MKQFNFYLRVFPNGDQYLSNFSVETGYSSLTLILDQLGHSAEELKYFLNTFIEAKNSQIEKLIGYNTLSIIVRGELCEVGEEDIKRENFNVLPSQIVKKFIEEAITFREFYESGQIPHIIPQSKFDSWSCVPNEFVKDEYWKRKEDQDIG